MKYILLGLLLIFTSCENEHFIYYQYNSTTVTRIDKGNKIYLYYGKYNCNNLPESYVKAEYSGLNSGMQAYLTFLPDETVEIRRVMSMFEKVGMESKFKIIEEDNTIFNPWMEKIKNNYKNTIEISDIKALEQESNAKNHSKINARY